MSKRAEKAANAAYPFVKRKFAHPYGVTEFDGNYDRREVFQEGYEQAEKDIIERACEWLFAHLTILVDYYDEDIHENADRSEFIKLFRKQMEEE